jgi:hypothetical protein
LFSTPRTNSPFHADSGNTSIRRGCRQKPIGKLQVA